MHVNPDLNAGRGTVYEVTTTPGEEDLLGSGCDTGYGIAVWTLRDDQQICERKARLGMPIDEWLEFKCGLDARPAEEFPGFGDETTVISCLHAEACRGIIEGQKHPAQRVASAVASIIRTRLYDANRRQSAANPGILSDI